MMGETEGDVTSHSQDCRHEIFHWIRSPNRKGFTALKEWLERGKNSQ